MYFQTEYQDKGYALVTAAAKGDVDGIRSLLGHNADIRFNEDLPLRAAAFTGNLAALRVIVEYGGDVHANNEEALLYAAKRCDVDMTRFLLAKGASVEAMRQHHAQEIDAACLGTIDTVLSEKPAEVFRDNLSVVKDNLKGKRRFNP